MKHVHLIAFLLTATLACGSPVVIDDNATATCTNCGYDQCGSAIGQASVQALPGSPCLVPCSDDAGCGAGTTCVAGYCLWAEPSP